MVQDSLDEIDQIDRELEELSEAGRKLLQSLVVYQDLRAETAAEVEEE